MAKDSFYFPHDTNARTDEKMIHLLSVLDWVGYGIYWAIIEKLHESSDGWLEADCERIAFDLRTQCAFIKQILSDFNLFKFDGTRFTSDRVLRNLEYRNNKSGSARNSAKARWNKALTDYANAMRTQCDGNARKERKGKERKGNKEESTDSASHQVFIDSLKTNVLYKHIDIDRELLKMQGWIKDHPGRKLTPTFIKNWLNKIEPPVEIKKSEQNRREMKPVAEYVP